jgi:two-component system nitrate/nitrite response regulator NarL
MADERPAGIRGSGNPVHPLAEVLLSPLARRWTAAALSGAGLPASFNAGSGCLCHARSMRLRALIVDDNLSFKLAAEALLEREGIAVVGLASTGAEALRKVEELRPDVALIDLDLGEESGFELARQLREVLTATQEMILISTHVETDFAELIAASPAIGFLSKSDLSARAIHRLLGTACNGASG